MVPEWLVLMNNGERHPTTSLGIGGVFGQRQAALGECGVREMGLD